MEYSIEIECTIGFELSPTKFPGLITEWKCDYWLAEQKSANKPYGEGIRFEDADQSKSLKSHIP